MVYVRSTCASWAAWSRELFVNSYYPTVGGQSSRLISDSTNIPYIHRCFLFFFFLFSFFLLYIQNKTWRQLCGLSGRQTIHIKHVKCEALFSQKMKMSSTAAVIRVSMVKYSHAEHEANFDQSLRKHAYSSMYKISPPKTENFQIKNL